LSGCERERNGSGSYLRVSFGVGSIESLGSVATVFLLSTHM